MSMATTLAAAFNRKPTHVKYDIYKYINEVCVSNERKGRFMYWTFEDGSALRAYGYNVFDMVLKVQ